MRKLLPLTVAAIALASLPTLAAMNVKVVMGTLAVTPPQGQPFTIDPRKAAEIPEGSQISVSGRDGEGLIEVGGVAIYAKAGDSFSLTVAGGLVQINVANGRVTVETGGRTQIVRAGSSAGFPVGQVVVRRPNQQQRQQPRAEGEDPEGDEDDLEDPFAKTDPAFQSIQQNLIEGGLLDKCDQDVSPSTPC